MTGYNRIIDPHYREPVCDRHGAAWTRFRRARSNWIIVRRDPEPFDKIERLYQRVQSAIHACHVCRPRP